MLGNHCEVLQTMGLQWNWCSRDPSVLTGLSDESQELPLLFIRAIASVSLEGLGHRQMLSFSLTHCLTNCLN